MSAKPCARVENTDASKCHYVWCRQHKACIERPGTMVKMFKVSAGPNPYTGRKRAKKAA